MPDPGLNIGPLEELRPYSEPPHDDIDPWVTKEKVNLGFQWDRIQDALTNKTLNNVMATYLILNTEMPKLQCRTIWVRPFHSPDHSPAPTQEVQPEHSSFQQAEQQPDNHESGQKAKSLLVLQPARSQDHHSWTQPEAQDCHSWTQTVMEDPHP
ncbi:hypothetical protein mRhiFer1_010065 [Rhinolophus ferrumequinum]|uniref:Uncharacterized protein n=1 Tax=Rhinolophus ferrumequinum TaxID=59479 RepID=A0A7J7Y5Q3_RHIFE|nr:hypothetical protein mRhiFer1_010065 [Rhinolophus ferrumequinum]